MRRRRRTWAQETIISVAKQMPGFRYDRGAGHLQGLAPPDHQAPHRRCPAPALPHGEARRASLDDAGVAEEVAELPDAQSRELDAVWETEWKSHLHGAALERVKRRVKPEQFQMFDLYVLRGWPVAKVAEALGASRHAGLSRPPPHRRPAPPGTGQDRGAAGLTGRRAAKRGADGHVRVEERVCNLIFPSGKGFTQQ
jgi:hypothetical protein